MNSSFSFVCIALLLFYYVDWVTLALPWAVLFERRYLFTSHCTNYYDTNDDTMILHDKKENGWLTSTRLNQESTNMTNSDLLMVYRTTPFEGLIKFWPWRWSILPLGWYLRSPEKDLRIRHPSSWRQRRLILIVGYIEPSPQSQIGEKNPEFTC